MGTNRRSIGWWLASSRRRRQRGVADCGTAHAVSSDVVAENGAPTGELSAGVVSGQIATADSQSLNNEVASDSPPQTSAHEIHAADALSSDDSDYGANLARDGAATLQDELEHSPRSSEFSIGSEPKAELTNLPDGYVRTKAFRAFRAYPWQRVWLVFWAIVIKRSLASWSNIVLPALLVILFAIVVGAATLLFRGYRALFTMGESAIIAAMVCGGMLVLVAALWSARALRPRTSVSSGDVDFNEDFNNRPHAYGRMLVHFLPGRLRTLLKALGDGLPETPALVIRGLYPSFWRPFGRPGSPADPSYYLKGGLYELISAALIAASGAELRRKHDPIGGVYQDWYTNVLSEKHMFAKRDDQHLWFRTAMPESVIGVSDEHPVAKIAVMSCVDNPIKDPICILRAVHVVKMIGKPYFERLKEVRCSFFDGWSDRLESVTHESPAKSVVVGDFDELDSIRVTFDPNRLRVPPQLSYRVRLRSLMDAIEAASGNEQKIVLGPGDALVIDNYRALTRRQERSNRWVPTYGRPARRWLRVYYGFPRKPP